MSTYADLRSEFLAGLTPAQVDMFNQLENWFTPQDEDCDEDPYFPNGCDDTEYLRDAL